MDNGQPTPDMPEVDNRGARRGYFASEKRSIYVVCIDIKDGWFDIIHAYDNREAAEAYVAWERQYVGDAVYVSPVPIDSEWEPPQDRPQPTKALRLVPLEDS